MADNKQSEGNDRSHKIITIATVAGAIAAIVSACVALIVFGMML